MGPAFFFKAGTHRRVGTGQFKFIEGSTHIKPRSPHQDGVFSTAGNVGNNFTSACLKLGNGRLFGEVHNIDQMMRNALGFGGSNFCGTDVHTPIELHGIGVNAFTPQFFGERNGQSAFSGAGGANDSENGTRRGFSRCW